MIMEPHSRGPALHEAERNQYFLRSLVEEFGMDSLRRHNEDFTLRAAAAPARGPRRWEKEAFSTHGSPGQAQQFSQGTVFGSRQTAAEQILRTRRDALEIYRQRLFVVWW